MNKVISIYEAKTNLSKLVKKAEAGQTIYIGAYGRMQAKLVPLQDTGKERAPRLGAWADNSAVVIPDNFDDPDPEIAEMFENSRIFPDETV